MDNYTPFAFFRTFLEKDIYLELDKFYFYSDPVDILNSLTGADGNIRFTGEIIKRDKVNHTIEYTDSGEKKITSLEENIKEKLSTEINKSIQYIEKGLEQRLMNPEEIKNFTFFMDKGLSTIKNTKAYSEFSFLKKYFSKIEIVVNAYADLNKNTRTTVIINNVYSYILTAENPETIIDKLYTELINQQPNPLIHCTKEEFINAFTGKEVTEGIKWLIIGKNKKTSKPSLFYFIDKLIDSGLISKSIYNDYNKYIKYIFRDKDGNELQNIKQSKSTFSKKPQLANTIDNIISSL